jgi:X-Pro dipeptidyl-peptidase
VRTSTVLYDFINSGDPARRPYCIATVRDGEMAPNLDRVTGDYTTGGPAATT